jgi:DNA gyrase subunit A
LIIISLGEGDSLRWARISRPAEEVLVATRDGFASRFRSAELTSTSRTSRGVRALKLREGDEMADIDIIRASLISASNLAIEAAAAPLAKKSTGADDLFVLVVTEKGYGKRITMDEFKIQKKGGKGVTALKFKEKAGGGGKLARLGGKSSDADAVSCMRVCRNGDEIVLSTAKGTVIRQSVDALSVQSRLATGVLIQRIAKDDKITMVDVVPSSQVAETVLSLVE